MSLVTTNIVVGGEFDSVFKACYHGYSLSLVNTLTEGTCPDGSGNSCYRMSFADTTFDVCTCLLKATNNAGEIFSGSETWCGCVDNQEILVGVTYQYYTCTAGDSDSSNTGTADSLQSTTGSTTATASLEESSTSSTASSNGSVASSSGHSTSGSSSAASSTIASSNSASSNSASSNSASSTSEASDSSSSGSSVASSSSEKSSGKTSTLATLASNTESSKSTSSASKNSGSPSMNSFYNTRQALSFGMCVILGSLFISAAMQ